MHRSALGGSQPDWRSPEPTIIQVFILLPQPINPISMGWRCSKNDAEKQSAEDALAKLKQRGLL
jgi:dsRNA-specific ribonuclease